MKDSNRKFCLSGRVFEKEGKMTLGTEDFFRIAAEKNCACIELRHTQINPWSSEIEIKKTKELSKKYSLPVEMITMRKGKLNEKKDYSIFLEYLSFAEKLKCRQIKLSGTDFTLLNRAAEDAEKRGIKIGTNNHIGTPLATKQGTLEYLDKASHPNFKLLFDPSHLWINNDLADKTFIEKIKDRISYLVVQDYMEGEGEGFEKIAKRTVRGSKENEPGAVGYENIMETIEELGCNIPYGLVQAGALYFLSETKGEI